MRRMLLSSVKVPVLVLLSVATIITASSHGMAQPGCSQWDLNGEWRFVQTNMQFSYSPKFSLVVTEDGIQGSGYYLKRVEAPNVLWVFPVGDDLIERTDGSVDGTINGDSIQLTVYWLNQSIGIYTGKINAQGRIQGSAFEKQNPQNRADWYSDRTAKCLVRAKTSDRANTTSGTERDSIKSGGRVTLPGGSQPSTLSKCEAAAAARSRNSPAASGLTEQCLAIVNDLAIKGQAIAQQDPSAPALRSKQPNTLAQRGFDIGLAAAGQDTEHGRGKQAIHDSLSPAEQIGFNAALSYALGRNRSLASERNAVLAAKGEAIANQDPLALALRNLQPDGPTRRGFDIGMSAAERDTEPGPGKQRIHDSLLPAEQTGFTAAVTFLLARNKHAKIAAVGAVIAESDVRVAQIRSLDGDPFYQLGFDIASGLFGDPAKGSVGSTQLGPGGIAIRAGLNAAGQRGFDASMKYHFGRNYR